MEKITIPEGRYQGATINVGEHAIIIGINIITRTVLLKLYQDGTWEEL